MIHLVGLLFTAIPNFMVIKHIIDFIYVLPEQIMYKVEQY